MNIKRSGGIAAIALVGAIALASCAANEGGGTEAPSDLSGTLVGAGSSAVGAAQETWIAEFQTANPEVTITYDPAGSGAGRETFLAGGSDFAGTDRAFKDEELAAGGFASCAADSGIVQLPLYISPIAVIFNVEGVDTLNLDADTIAGIFAGTITNWTDEAITSQNEGVELPDLAITPVHRSDDSGTTENFTDYLAQAAPEVWTYEADGVWPISSGEAAQGTSGVVDAVTNGTGTIGYADASRAGGLGTVAVLIGEDYVPYSAEAAAAVVDASPFVEGRPEFDLSLELDRTPDSEAYPIVLVAYLVGCETYLDAAQAELVKAYFTYMASPEGQAAASEGAGSAPISDALFERVTAAIEVIG
ncbi:phosphate ABC transporter substrate-binding protein PstS [Pseudolysinimonas yzui]|uniref:Phosphate-binding protein n=1 Tax=Pseudolysinimonas yzui TaxID=2708254 RepID=A0A8J3GRK8_9MICO|nr:phosphate ABC transporter substrate-binding protein PstS [Pseudolysinimonas yzui]GHF19855.1 phosphate-binding protein PstS [Pseudolysinimonas yzui]